METHNQSNIPEVDNRLAGWLAGYQADWQVG